MREKSIIKNNRPFNEVCNNSFGREVLFTNEIQITADNIIVDLQKRLSKHNQNSTEIDYLYNYYLGNQPVLYRTKQVRPEINNKIVQNFAYFIVETKTADIASEPIQYVLRGTDESLSQQIADLNGLMDSEDKSYLDISIARWRSICGTAYRFISNDNTQSSILDETDFRLSVLDPRDTFVVYYNNGLPAYSCQIYKNAEGKKVYYVYTNTECFEIISNKITSRAVNGFRAIPVIEYPNNEFRLSDIEITIGLCDAANEMASSRLDGQDQFVQSFIKFLNCEIDEEKFKRLTRCEPLTDDELSDFIARQLVETSQSTKAVAQIFSQMYPDSDIVYVKARNVSVFRNSFDLLKSRAANDLHHAKDAYLNIVVGNVYDVLYTKNKANFIKGLQTKKYSLNQMFNFNINGAWVKDNNESLSIVKKPMNKNFSTSVQFADQK